MFKGFPPLLKAFLRIPVFFVKLFTGSNPSYYRNMYFLRREGYGSVLKAVEGSLIRLPVASGRELYTAFESIANYLDIGLLSFRLKAV